MQEGIRTRWSHKWHDQTPWTCCQQNTLWAVQQLMEEWHSSCFMENSHRDHNPYKGKDKKDPNSYHPISLLSCLGKLLERATNKKIDSIFGRTENTVTKTDWISETQKHRRSAGPHCPRDRGSLSRKKVVSVFFDLTKAFDKVWSEGHLLKILESGVSGRTYRWIWCFLHHRSARVKLDCSLGKSAKMRERVPQGGVISPTLFLLYFNNITTVLPRHVSNTFHADDVDVWSASEHIKSSAYRIQESVNKAEQWTNDWGSSDQWSEDSGHSFLPLHLQRKSRHKASRQLDTTPRRDSQLSRGKAWHPTLMEATHRGHGEGKHQEACRPEEIVWNTLGCHLQDSENRLHGSSPAISVIWGQPLGDSSQGVHQLTGQSSEYRVEDNSWCHENHSHSWNGEDRWS